jgi:hypothetical protein
MYLVGHWYAQAAISLAIAAAASFLLYYCWYRHLPQAGPNRKASVAEGRD